MTLVIRPGTLGDLPHRGLDIDNASGLEHEAVLPLTATEKWFAQIQQYPSYTLWVACMAERIVGRFPDISPDISPVN